MKITVNGQNLERVKQFSYLGSLVTEDCRCHDVKWRIALGKEAFNKKGDLMRGSLSLRGSLNPQPSLEETYGESICLECCVVRKRNVDSTKRRYSAT